MLLSIVFNGQILSFTRTVTRLKTLCVQVVGITTGLACAVQLSNLYLIGMDATFQHTFSSSLCLYKRFVDDVLVVLSERIKTDKLLEVLNSFSSDIVYTNDGTESDTCVVFFGS